MIKREIEICGKKIPFRYSATIPRLYRAKFKRDTFKDLSKLDSSYSGKKSERKEFQIEDLEIFENVAYIMAYHADNTIPSTIEEWLDQFEMFSIYEVLPQILEFWGDNMQTDIASKKRIGRSEREMTMPLFLLRSVEIGISIQDMDLLTVGLVIDMRTEKANDGMKYNRVAT